MLGVIAKVLLIFAVVVAAIVVVLNFTGVYTWGRVGFSSPDVAACERLATTFKNKPVLTEVRWSWVQDQTTEPGEARGEEQQGLSYGWSCYYEFGDDSKATIPYERAAP